MLRLFRKYYPIRNVIFASGEGLVIYFSVFIAAYIKIGNDINMFDHWIVFKTLLITIVCQISLYYNDLYDLKVTNNYIELGIRLLQALGIATIFFGRQYEINQLHELISDQAEKLVTLTGPGGVGKTRLALQVAAGLADHFPDGVWLVELSVLDDPQAVSSTVAAVLDLQEESEQALVQTLIYDLRDKSILLVLDNCEH